MGFRTSFSSLARVHLQPIVILPTYIVGTQGSARRLLILPSAFFLDPPRSSLFSSSSCVPRRGLCPFQRHDGHPPGRAGQYRQHHRRQRARRARPTPSAAAALIGIPCTSRTPSQDYYSRTTGNARSGRSPASTGRYPRTASLLSSPSPRAPARARRIPVLSSGMRCFFLFYFFF